jgi:hypothetical protein
MRVTSLVLGFFGALLACIDASHFAAGFTPEGVRLGLGHHSWIWWHLGFIGFVLITAAFLLELLQHFRSRKQPRGRKA